MTKFAVMKQASKVRTLPQNFTFLLVFRVLFLITCSVSQDIKNDLPNFAEPITNISTTAGRNIKLSCTINKLAHYQVAWSHLDTKTLLSMHNKVITGNPRYRVSQRHSRTWMLEIDDVQQRDAGRYMCQINTSPMRSQVGTLEVVVPPEIDDLRTSVDITVAEKSSVSMMCNAFGYPKPTISWLREDGNKIYISRKKAFSMVTGAFLNITSVNRNHMGAYLCVADNGVPPSVSKRIQLSVKFPPKVDVPSELVGIPIGSDVKLECDVEVFPKAMLYWTKNNVMIISNSKFNTVSLASSSYKTRMTLVIYNLMKEDFGMYICHVESSLGRTNGSITLYETRGSSLKSSSSMSAKFDKESNVSHNALARTNTHSSSGEFNGNGFRVVKSDVMESIDEESQENASFSLNQTKSCFNIFFLWMLLYFL